MSFTNVLSIAIAILVTMDIDSLGHRPVGESACYGRLELAVFTRNDFQKSIHLKSVSIGLP